MPRRIVLLTLLSLLVSAAGAAHASTRERAPDGKDLKRAEAVLAKLRRLEEAAASADSDAFRKTAGRLYPGLFAGVARLRDGDLKTDLATAVSLYESAFRTRREGAGATLDCSRELRDSYSRLCRETSGDDPALLMRAKARLHARWAETELRHARGERDAGTLDALSLIHAERDTDLALAEEALHVLKQLAEEMGVVTSEMSGGVTSSAGDSVRGASTREQADRSAEGLSDHPSERLSDRPSERLSVPLEEVDRILASLPRDHARRLLLNARDAFRDCLFRQLENLPARALVVSANSFAASDALPQLTLRADDADRAALGNLRAALKFIARAEEEIGEARRRLNAATE
jgi:hypothetical protein